MFPAIIAYGPYRDAFGRWGRLQPHVEGTCAEPVFHADMKAVVKDSVKGVGKAAGGLMRGLLGGKK
jgi:hypothetical protein